MGYITNFLIESWMIDHDIPSLGDGHQAMNKVLYTLMFWTPNTGWMTLTIIYISVISWFAPRTYGFLDF